MAVADPIRQHRSSPATSYQWRADRATELAACWRVALQLSLSTPEPNFLAAPTCSLNSLKTSPSPFKSCSIAAMSSKASASTARRSWMGFYP